MATTQLLQIAHLEFSYLTTWHVGTMVAVCGILHESMLSQVQQGRGPHLVPSGMRGAVAQEDAHEDDRDKRERLQQFQTQFKQR